LAMLAVAVASVTTTLVRRHVTLALVLSGSGFVLAVVYAFYGAPNVVLVAVLVETILTLLLISTLRLIPYHVLYRQARLPSPGLARKVFVSVAAGAFAFVVVWGALSQPPAGSSVAEEHIRLTPDAHAKNVVTATLADFRGLDTLGEITVVVLALLGVRTLIGGSPAEETAGAHQPAARGVTRGIARLLYLPTFVIAAAVLVKGFVQTGDGFSAGVIAALGVVLRYMAFGHEATRGMPAVRHAAAVSLVGLLVTLGVAAAPLFLGEPVLTHFPRAGTEPLHIGTIEVMTAVLFDFGIFLLVFGFAVGLVSSFARSISQREAADPETLPREGGAL